MNPKDAVVIGARNVTFRFNGSYFSWDDWDFGMIFGGVVSPDFFVLDLFDVHSLMELRDNF
jgi:hypothetical protein